MDRKGGLKEVIAAKNLRHIRVSHRADASPAGSRKTFSTDTGRINITETFAPMVQTLDGILDGDNKEKVSYHLAASMVTLDVETLGTLLPQHIESEFGERLFGHILREMDDEKFEKMVLIIRRLIEETESGTDNIGTVKIESMEKTYRKMMESEMGRSLNNRLIEKEALEKRNKKKQLTDLKTGLGRILKGETGIFRDRQVMRSLPNAISQLLSRGKSKTARTIIYRLGKGLVSTDEEVRGIVAETLVNTVDKFSALRRLETIERLSDELIGWIRLENASTPGYEKMCIYLETLAQSYILEKNFSEYHRILKTFQVIQNAMQKEEESQFNASVTLNAITTSDMLDLLLSEFLTNEENKREHAIYSLVQMGPACVPRLLDLLKESHDKSIRAKIVQVVADIGPSAIPALENIIRNDGPWYYIRNLVLIFGKIGDESHLKFIHPLLAHEEHRVQREALNCIYAIGGEKREDILISLLSTTDDRLKTDAVGMLGALKCDRAVPMLHAILESKSFLTSKARSDLEEKVCNVLGSLGARQSIPVLRSIVEQKRGIRVKKTWGEKVQLAADRALAMIENETTS